MSTYIIADIHLSVDTEDLMNKFEKFYSNLNSNDSVYIIGDLFNYYVGIDETNSTHLRLKNIFSNALKRNIKTFFQHGNRDFLLSQKDAKYFNFKLINDTEILELDNNRILLVHGDELCNEKLSYKLFRYFSRCKLHQIIFMLITTHKYRTQVAKRMRNNSINNYKKNRKKILIDNNIALKFLNKFQANIIIHGHTHTKDCTTLKGKTIIDVGDWNDEYAHYVKIDNGEIKLLKFY